CAVVLRVPEGAVPVTVKVALPPGAACAAVRVNVELPPALTVAGLKLPLTPAGRPLMESVRGSGEPDDTCIETCIVPLWPLSRLSDAGETERLKSFIIVTCAVALRVLDGAVPVIVNVVDPPAADDATLRVKVETPPALTVAGLKLPLTPAGRPVTESVIVS